MADRTDADERPALEQEADAWFFPEGDEVEYAAEVLRDCLLGAHAYLAEIANEEAADASMTAFLAPYLGCDDETVSWRKSLVDNEAGLLSELPAGNLLASISGYAHHGVFISRGKTPERRRALLEQSLDRFETFLAKTPAAAWGIELGPFHETVLMARGRWALDNGEPIEPQALALFGGVTERRIRNMMSKTEKLLTNEGGRIPARDALDWLRRRKSFTPSRWADDDRLAQIFDEEPIPADDVHFVPIGPDDRCFHPGLRRDGVFHVGDRDDERAFESFEEALGWLQRMPVPVWRRPTIHGRWTQVRGVRWDRMRMIDLEAMADDVAGL